MWQIRTHLEKIPYFLKYDVGAQSVEINNFLVFPTDVFVHSVREFCPTYFVAIQTVAVGRTMSSFVRN